MSHNTAERGGLCGCEYLNYLDLNFIYHVLLQANQQLTEWQSAFSTAALTALHGFFAEQGMDTNEAHQGYARTALSS
jgi:hypothetical protein